MRKLVLEFLITDEQDNHIRRSGRMLVPDSEEAIEDLIQHLKCAGENWLRNTCECGAQKIWKYMGHPYYNDVLLCSSCKKVYQEASHK